MKKLLVISDTHYTFIPILEIITTYHPDIVIHLGDCTTDVQHISTHFPNLELIQVRGNCDDDLSIPTTQLINIENTKIMLTHGHLYHVKEQYMSIMYAALENNADAVLFGHTHIPYLEYIEDKKLLLFNPGSISIPYPGNKPSYGILQIQNSEINAAVHYIN